MSRRIAQSSVNWAAIAERVPPNQKTNFVAFKTRSDKYLRRLVIHRLLNNFQAQIHNFYNFSVLANPESPPKIDWAAYKAKVPVAGMVDSFQKQYESLKVPYPADTLSAQVDQQKSQVQKEVEAFIKASNARIADNEKAILHLQSLLPYNQMTMEDFRDAFPEEALDPINRPTFWPHTPEEQLENQPKEEHHH